MSTRDAPPLPIQPDEVIAGRYRVEGVIASGGMGVILAARHRDLDQRVAIKLLRPEIAGVPEVATRFLREARTSANLHNEHAARVFDVGTLPSGVPFMVMEHLTGVDLEQLITSRGPLPAEEAVGYVLEALEAIAEAHSLGIVHRDLKPANLFLAKRPDGTTQIKVLDFGISKAFSEGPAAASPALTATQNLVGSPAYMAPEQVRTPKSVDGRADLWALGLILHELLTGRRLFEGETVGETLAAVLEREVTPLRALRPDVAPGLAQVVKRCLTRDPEARYPSAAELARELAPFGPPDAQRSVTRIAGLSGEAPPSAAAPRTRAGSSRMFYYGLGAAGVVGALLLGAAWLLGSPASTTPAPDAERPRVEAPSAAPPTVATIHVSPAAAEPTTSAATSAAPTPTSATTTSATRPVGRPPPPKKKGPAPSDVLLDRQ